MGISTVCTVTVTDLIDLTRSNSAMVTLSTVSSDLIAIIEGGNQLDIGVDNGIVLMNGSLSYDPDFTEGAMVYNWTCRQVRNIISN